MSSNQESEGGGYEVVWPLPLHLHPVRPPELWFLMQNMADRLALGTLKYENKGTKYNYRETLDKVLAAYDEDGNTEHLIDAANYCLLEFTEPGHPKANFRETDSDESVPPATKE